MTNYISKSINYAEYCNLLETLMANGKTTGHDQSESYINYAKLNLARMRRLNKTVILTEDIKNELQKITKKYIWLVITEGWCGDAAQNIPVFYYIEKENPNIELRLILRDENLELMDRYLTNGGRSIPKLICLEKDSTASTGYIEKFVWGPRPVAVQNLTQQLLQQNVTKDEKSLAIQHWYNNDKTLTLQNEFLQLIKTLN